MVLSISNVNKIFFKLTVRQPILHFLSFIYNPMMSGAPAPYRIALSVSDSQSAILWIYVADGRGCLNEGGSLPYEYTK